MKLRLLIAAHAALLAACGQTGDLYLPDRQTGTVVTRPAPPASGDAPQTVDSPLEPASPAPEVAPPPGSEKTDEKKDGAQPPPK
jgi:predicted small lipoprotein YifL